MVVYTIICCEIRFFFFWIRKYHKERIYDHGHTDILLLMTYFFFICILYLNYSTLNVIKFNENTFYKL